MELISIVGAGVTLYCGWLTAKDELRCWRHFQAAAGNTVEKNRGGTANGYKCGLLTVSVSRL